MRSLALVSIAALEDTAFLIKWEDHLQTLQQAGNVSVWSERHMDAGIDRIAVQYKRLSKLLV